MSLAVAMIVAAVISFIGFPFGSLQAWVSWATWRAAGLLFAYLAAAAVVGGVLGWLVGSHSKAQLSDIDWVKGLFYGVTGALIIRADFSSREKNLADKDKNPADVKSVASLLASFFQYTNRALESVTRRAIDKWLADQSPESLEDFSWLAVETIRPTLTGRQFITQMELTTDALEKLWGDAIAQKRARGSLMYFLRTYYLGESLPKPHLPPWMPTADQAGQRLGEVTSAPKVADTSKAAAETPHVPTTSEAKTIDDHTPRHDA